MKDVYIFGHKKPDTDTVTSAIALSYLKNKVGIKAKPMILGHINKETEFALKYFNIEVPEYLEDVKLQIKDLNYYKDCFIKETDSLNKTYKYMSNKNITGVPIVDDNNKFKGLLTSKMIGSELINGDFTKLNTSYNNILDVLKGEEVLKFTEEIDGRIVAAAYRSTTILNTLDFKSDTIMIVGDRHSIIEAAVNSGIKLLIIVGNGEIKEEHIQIAKQNKVNIIRTYYDTFHTAKLIGLSNYVKNLLTDTRTISFNENDYYDDFKEKSIKLGHNNYPVVDDNNNCLGLIRITDINKKNKKQVILVDHNEASQSVEGLDEAEILEIIDHHNISSLTTNMPINFRNMTVGSTNTIIYSIFNENNITIPNDIAGIMLSGILSDTLKFTSPTTTEYDKYVATILADIAGVNIDTYSDKMFKAGTNLKGKSIEEIIQGDMKLYEVDNKRISISQVITLNADEILEKKEEYIKKLNEMKNSSYVDIMILCVTDIIKDGSYIFFNEASRAIVAEAFGFETIEEGYFYSKCLSRKKQLVPLIMNVIR
ncbi:MAG: putative manganese-dependent inorganic diphosphatase [Bacilli bacterium]|nr:putative manganese-dependent inorganic diphosphatase [Bacilli bacterium]